MLVHAKPVMVVPIELVRAGQRDADVHRADSLDSHELDCLALVDFGRFGDLATRLVVVVVVNHFNKIL